jgi:unsaturated chondroitin disaccharide hydrolase
MKAAVRTLSIDEALDFGQRQIERLILDNPGKFPTYTDHGEWVFAEDPWAPTWSGGFLAGSVWMFAERTGSDWWRTQAEQYSLALEPRKHDSGTHDIGFVFDPSWGRWHESDGSSRARDVLVEAGRTMARRYQERGRYLATWVDPGSTFIDVMMNVGVIFRAAQLTQDEALHGIALDHCRTTMRYLMRGDGSTVHEGWFDTATGEFVRAATHQGWRSDSSWARGQAWAIYGFTAAHRYTGRGELLDAARRAADYYIAHTPPDGIPPNDWLDPAPRHRWEASAAAIAAAGMLHLAAEMTDPADVQHYRAYGLRVLETLRSTEFTAADVSGWQGILRHAVYHYGNELGVDESVMFGDYYFLEALQLASDLQPLEGSRP